MNKKWILFSLFFIFCLSFQNISAENLKGEATFFYHQQCQHCEKEMDWLMELEEEYPDFKVEYLNVEEEKASKHFESVLKEFDVSVPQVPFLVYEEQYFLGYLSKDAFIAEYNPGSENPSCQIDDQTCQNEQERPLAMTAMIFGLMDGFNPCAMWVLLVLMTLLLQKEKWKDVFLLGGTFIFVTAVFYYAMLNSWLNLRPFIPYFKSFQKIIAIIIIAFASHSLYKQQQKKACHMRQGPVRKKMIESIQKIEAQSSQFLALLAIAALALFVNLFELACSLGFPLAFVEILSIREIQGLEKQIYLMIYVFFFILDDLLILAIAGIKHRIKPFSSKWSQRIQIASSFLLLALGLVLFFKPQWLS